ncbi:hypothetical protein KDA_75070 [Dictyobacter alpinus]|uniref:Uncharacterized protein n=1 Tax=Dictyobacter alpinus TaxID=2014873 RepID=A0A402BKY1_9CHLR|nr:hypothetical protein [Dictyobacter alpinus]GCE32023.1 hypothetical protein KDA_75070 [Dictyobacter alpinus]
MEKRHILAIIAFGLSCLWLWAVVAFGKWSAEWWGISIWVYAVVLALAFIGIAALLRLLDIDDTTPTVVLCFLSLFVVLSLAEGVFISEPSLAPQAPSDHSVTSSSDSSSHSSFFYYSWWHEATSSGSSSSSSSHSSNKGAGYVLLVLLLIALLLLAAIIPHFWVVAVFVGAVLLWCFTIKEFRRSSNYYSY